MSETVPQSASDFLDAPQAGEYRPTASGVYAWSASSIHDRPWFSWAEAEVMRRDPQILFGLGILRAPLRRAKWLIRAKDPRISKFIEETLRSFWRHALAKVCSFHVYGIHAGELEFELRDGLIRFKALHDFHPLDARPLVFSNPPLRGRLAGVRVRAVRDKGSVDVVSPHAWWFAGHTEYGQFYGRPRIAGSFEPWLEKRSRHGAVDSRRLWYHKNAFRGSRVRFPIGTTRESEGVVRNNVDIAREIGEKDSNGTVTALPGQVFPGTDKYQWSIEDPESRADVAGLLDYPKELDREILIGMGIPPELVEAATVGSGYSGRAIPAQMFFTSMDETVSLLLDAVESQILRPLVAVNFGPDQWFEISPVSLAELVEKDPSQQSGGQTPQQPQQPEPQPQQQEQEQPDPLAAALSNAIEERVKAIAELNYPDLGGVNLGWSAARARTGNTKAVGTGENQGETLYGDAAKQALAPKAAPAASKPPTGPMANFGGHFVGSGDTEAIVKSLPELDTPEKQHAAKSVVAKVSTVLLSYLTELGAKSYAFVTEDLIPNADDYGTIFMSKDATGIGHDPEFTAGLPPAAFAKLAGKLIHKALSWVKGRSVNLSDAEADDATKTAKLIADLFAKVYASCEREEAPPSEEQIRELMQKKAESAGVELGWAAATSRTGGVKAVGTGPDTGKAAYGDKARSLLAGKGEKFKAENEGRTPKQNLENQKQKAEPKREEARRTLAAIGEDPSHAAKFTPEQLAEHISHLTRDELKEHAKKLAEKVGGKKAELAKRIAAKALGSRPQPQAKPEAKPASEPKASAPKKQEPKIDPKSMTPEQFGGEVQGIADGMAGESRFTSRKVFIGHAYDEFSAKHPGLNLDEFKSKLIEAHKSGHIELARADMAAHYNQDHVSKSEAKLGTSEFHGIVSEPTEEPTPAVTAPPRQPSAAKPKAKAKPTSEPKTEAPVETPKPVQPKPTAATATVIPKGHTKEHEHEGGAVVASDSQGNRNTYFPEGMGKAVLADPQKRKAVLEAMEASTRYKSAYSDQDGSIPMIVAEAKRRGLNTSETLAAISQLDADWLLNSNVLNEVHALFRPREEGETLDSLDRDPAKKGAGATFWSKGDAVHWVGPRDRVGHDKLKENAEKLYGAKS